MLPRESVYDKFNVKVVVFPTAEQLTLADARDHLRLIPYGSPPRHAEDKWIEDNIPVAREWCEGESMLSFVPQTLELGLERFPVADAPLSTLPSSSQTLVVNNGILLPFGPVISIESVGYGSVDSLQPIDPSSYYLNTYAKPARLVMKSGVWPSMTGYGQGIIVQYKAGYSLVGDSPQKYPFPFSLMAAMKLVLAHLFLNREDTSEIKLEQIPIGAQSLMRRHSAKIGFA